MVREFLRSVLPFAALAVIIAAQASVPSAQATQPAKSTKEPARAAAKPSTGAVVNINTATASDFEALPGIGAKTAARIVEYRQKNGPFKKIEELMNVRGVGEKNFLKLKPQLTLSPGKTTDDRQER